MAKYTPWMTSRQLIESVKRKITFPTSQNTFTEQEILLFANEEMQISQVPSVMIYHEEYFVLGVAVPLQANINRYPIPDRAIGMKMRDIMYQDTSGNLTEMSRMSPDDKAYWQSSSTTWSGPFRFYIEGNDIVLSPVNDSASGSLIFYIYLRPNQLVLDDRACISQNFVKTITLSSVQVGDTVTIGSVILTAGTDFAVNASDIVTATNLVTAIETLTPQSATNGSPGTNIVTIRYSVLSTTIASSNSNTLAVQSTQGIEFDQVSSTYLDPDTLTTSPLYVDNELIDFLQTKPGHRTYKYDIQIPSGGIAGNIINFNASDVPYNFLIGDYICLANECIIPQIPPDLHNGLAERTGARILASIGDQAGLQTSMTKIAEIDQRQSTLLDNRAEANPQKVTGRRGLLRYGKRGSNFRF